MIKTILEITTGSVLGISLSAFVLTIMQNGVG